MQRFFDTSATLEQDKLFAQACSENESVNFGTQTYLAVFAHKFGVAVDAISRSEFLETKVLKNVLAKCPSIPRDINVNGHASWRVHTPQIAMDNALIVNYPTLTLAQRREMVEAYNTQYGPFAAVYEDAYQGGYCLEAVNGILFGKAHFCKNVLPDLLKLAQPELEAGVAALKI